jgi:hypothetical protein
MTARHVVLQSLLGAFGSISASRAAAAYASIAAQYYIMRIY